LDKNRKLLKYISLQLEPEGRKLNNYVYDFLEVGKFMYASTSYGLYRIDKKNFRVSHYLLPVLPGEDPNKNALTRLCKDENGTIWIGSWFAGIIWFDPKTQVIQKRFIVKNETGVAAINVIMDVKAVNENGKNILYAASYNGLVKIDAASVTAQEVSYEQYIPDKSDPEAISHHLLSALYKDDLDNLWIASAAGINKVKITPALFRTCLLINW
jgi:ligand-binding sensor domain-containing protein